MSDLNVLPFPGSNQPPDPLDEEALKARLDADYPDLVKRFHELEQGGRRLPAKLDTASQAKQVIDWVAQQARSWVTDAKAKHEKEKGPYLRCGRIIDGFFNPRIKRLENIIRDVTWREKAYHDQLKAETLERDRQAKIKAAEELRQAEAERLRLEAEMRAKLRTDRPAAIQAGISAERAAKRAATAAAIIAAPVPPVHIHGDFNATGYGRENWKWDIDDMAAVPRGYLTVDKQAVDAAIAEGVREIPGLRIWDAGQFIIRKC